jgi:arginyl-tRNA synthetase
MRTVTAGNGIAMNIQQLLQERLGQALTGLVPDPAPYVAMLKPAQDARFGDYQANCAMSLAKVLGKPPRAIAQQIVDRLPVDDVLEKPEIAGPGFINLRLRNDWLARQLQAMGADARLGVAKVPKPRTYVIDFSSPNVAKPMHVGHLRSTIIGDALTRLFRFLGHTVITDNHLGDWGTQFGIILYGYKHYLDEAAFKADPTRELARLYLHVRSLFKKPAEDDDADADDPVQEACRQETAKLHAGDPENLRLWKTFMPLCRELIDHVYRRLGVTFDYYHGESFYNPMLADVVNDLQKRGIAKESESAIVVWHGENEPPSLIRKRDGAFTYTTTDLATIRYRVEHFKAEVVLYVVDFRQHLHFKHLFEIARKWGHQVELEHVQFGTVMGQDRKPFKTREGGIVGLDELLDEAVAHAARVYKTGRQEAAERGQDVPELAPDELHRIYEVVGYGAVKYADLSQNRTTDYVFDWNKMMATDGNTATYMQYAYARNRSIFHKGGVDETPFRTNPPLPTLEHPAERALVMQLLRFEEALIAAAADYRPSQITGCLWDLAKSYSGFFQNCPVLKAETPQLRQSRLLLCDLTARMIQCGLGLLGIRTVERM